MNLKKLLAKLAAGEALSKAEVAFVRSKEADLSDEQKEQLDAAEETAEEGEEEEGEKPKEGEEKPAGAGDEVDEDAVKALLTKTAEEVLGKKFEAMSTRLVEKFMDGVKEQRKKGITVKQDKAQDVTREFMKALFEGDTSRIKALTTATGDTPKAGYTIPTELLSEVLRLVNDTYGVARREFRYLPFGGAGNTRTIPTLASGVTLTWTGEGVAKTSSEPGFGLVTQTLKKLAVIVPMTEELLEDTAIDLKGLIADLVAEAMALEEDTQFFAGTGSPWTGIINNGAVNLVTMAATKTTFAQITADDLLSMISATPIAARRNGKFYMHTEIMDYIRKLKDSAGNYIYQSPSADAPAKIWNKEVVELDVLPAAGATAVSKKFVIFGDLKRAAIFGDKGQIRVKLLEEATITDTDGETAINLAEQDEVALRFVERVGYVLAIPTAVTVLRTAAA